VKRVGDFNDATKIKVLLWSNRHCCLCGKVSGSDLEVHHIIPLENKGTNHVDNAIPLCYNCHGNVMKYNPRHPRGNKYRVDELKSRRDQVYEEQTRHLVPPVHFEITQLTPKGMIRKLPNAGFNIFHKGSFPPVRVRVLLEPYLGRQPLPKYTKGHYSGKKTWNLNPGHGVNGHFWLPKKVLNTQKQIEVKVTVTIIDRYDREHQLLPVGWVYMRKYNGWYFNP
jgi:hypothetical protein